MGVNAIAPGLIAIGMMAEIPVDDKAVYAQRRIALRRYDAPREVADIPSASE